MASALQQCRSRCTPFSGCTHACSRPRRVKRFAVRWRENVGGTDSRVYKGWLENNDKKKKERKGRPRKIISPLSSRLRQSKLQESRTIVCVWIRIHTSSPRLCACHSSAAFPSNAHARGKFGRLKINRVFAERDVKLKKESGADSYVMMQTSAGGKRDSSQPSSGVPARVRNMFG